MWKKGAILQGRLVENSDKNYWIVSIDGKLIGVRNDSGLDLKLNQKVEMEVVTESPLGFRLLGRAANTLGLNIRV